MRLGVFASCSQIALRVKGLLFAVPFVALLCGFPMCASAVTSTAWGQSASIAGYQVDTSSSIVAEVGYFRSSTSVYISPSAVPGALQAQNIMWIGKYSAYPITRYTSYVTNGSTSSMLTASQTYSYSSNPGWGEVASSGTGRANLNGWVDFYAGNTSVLIPVRSAQSFPALSPRSGYLPALGISGKYGYIKESEQNPRLDALSPQETLEFYKANEGTLYINVYDENLIDVIDRYPVSFGISYEG